MEYYFVGIILLLFWLGLNNQLKNVNAKLDSLKKELEKWKGTATAGTVTGVPVNHADSGESKETGVSDNGNILVEEEAMKEEAEETLPEFAAATVSVPAPPVVAASLDEEPVEKPVYPSMPPPPVGVLSELGPVCPETEPAIPAAEVSAVPESPVHNKKTQVNFEKYIGENLFSKIGILVLVVGVGLFVKYAIDQDWINEVFRTILGFAAGSALLFVAGRLQKKYRTFSSLLAGGAFAIFYVTVAIAFHYYGLFSQTVAFIILVVITILMSALALLYDRRELAVIALIGGFIAPFLVSRGEGNYVILFTYLAILNMGMFALSLRKKWMELPVISFGFTYLVMCLYTRTLDFPSDAAMPAISALFTKLFLFATLFYFIFLLPVISILKSGNEKANRVLLWVVIANNFIYLAFGLYYLEHMQCPVRLNGLLTLFIALVNLLLVMKLKKEKQDFRLLVYSLLGLVLTFVSITVPIQLSGNYITLFWAAEMVVLLWLYTKSRIRLYEYFSFLMLVCTLGSYLMDLEHAVFSQYKYYAAGGTIFFNGSFATGLFTGFAFVAFAWLMDKNRSLFESLKLLKYSRWNILILCTGLLIIYASFVVDFNAYFPGKWFRQIFVLFTVAWILLLMGIFRKRFPMRRYKALYIGGVCASVGVYEVNVLIDSFSESPVVGNYLAWIATAVVLGTLYFVGRQYYSSEGYRAPRTEFFTVFINVVSVLFWLGVVNRFLMQSGLPDEFNAGFSIALTMAGFAQMTIGMRLHLKIMRMISLFTFSVVLLKLVLSDLWAMPTVGKILVFIMLGVILLILSFLYQKLKDVLFKNDHADEE